MERLIRKFGVEEVERCIPEEDKKLVANIKKSRNRAKRKQEAETEAEGEAGSKLLDLTIILKRNLFRL